MLQKILIHKSAQRNGPDSKTRLNKLLREWNQERLVERERWRASRRTTKDELSGRSEWTVLWQRWEPALTEWHWTSHQVMHKTNVKTAGHAWRASTSLLFTSVSPGFQNIQMRGTEPATAGLSASNVLTSYQWSPQQLWCTLLWALEVVFCYLTHFVCVWGQGFSRMVWDEAVAPPQQWNDN